MTFKVNLEDAQDPLVLGLDVGSTGTRSGLYDATGLPVRGRRHKVEHAFTTGADGTSTIDADQIVDEIRAVIDAVVAPDVADRIVGVGMDTYSSSLVGVKDGKAVTPCFTYADSRGSENVDVLREKLDEAAVQQRTGTRQHTSYLPARLMWLSEQDLDVDRWMSLSEYIHLQLLGTTAAGTSIAAWTGMLDRVRGTWDAELMEIVGVEVDQFSPIQDHDEPIAATFASLPCAAWYPALSDGFASNYGTGASDPQTAVISMATSGAMRVLVEDQPETLPSGLWSYRIDQRRALVGGALNDVGRAVGWMHQVLQLPDPEVIDEALRSDPVESTALVLPFFTGERATGWAGGARAVFTGVSAGHDAVDLFRAVGEGIALSFARVSQQLTEVAGAPRQILAAGGVCSWVPGFLQQIADALQAPVTPVTIKRATLHGTALAVLDVVAPDVTRARVETGETFSPHPDRAAYYRDRLARFEEVYAAVI